MFTRQRNKVEKAYRKQILPSLEIFENFVEFVIFLWRWLLAPAYIMLGFCLALLAWKTVQSAWSLRIGFMALEESMAIVKILGIVDMILVLNLIIMVLFVGYVNFVSKINLDNENDRPSWMDSLDYSGLKIQLLGSIVAISSVQLLRQYMDLDQNDHFQYQKFQWMIVFHLTFVGSILVFSIVNRIYHPIANEPEAEESGEIAGESENEEEDELPILVAAVTGHSIVLNRGHLNKRKHHDLRVGDVLEISSTAESITDPTTGEVIGWREDLIGTVKIERILERTSVAKIESKVPKTPAVTVGDAVRSPPRD